ncbi:MAG: hypothetical protein JWL85_441 [Candidatus Saccharibacteria bacterium]|nr:hypothetical protein [Candidatus Saccharibacteria bacterium]
MRNKNEAGFTIIELMIAAAVFSTVLLIVSYGVIQVGRAFYKGSTMSATQETTRTIIEDISQAIQFSGDTVTTTIVSSGPGGIIKGFCVGDRQYSYVLNKQLTDGTPGTEQARHVMMVDNVLGCNGTTAAKDIFAANPAGRELVGINMRLSKLDIQCARNAAGACVPGLFNITVGVASGDYNALRDSDGDGIKDTCDGGASNQFCATSRLTTTVRQRVQ